MCVCVWVENDPKNAARLISCNKIPEEAIYRVRKKHAYEFTDASDSRWFILPIPRVENLAQALPSLIKREADEKSLELFFDRVVFYFSLPILRWNAF